MTTKPDKRLDLMKEAWSPESSRDALLGFLASSLQRISDLERHLVGVATLASAGWAFLHKDSMEGSPDRVMFASLFAGLVSSSYNALYVARSAVNQRLIEMEAMLGLGYSPYLRTFEALGKQSARVVYLCTALFIPSMAMGSLVLCAIAIWHDRSEPRAVTQALLLCISASVIVWTSLVSIDGLLRVSKLANELLTRGRPK